MAECSNSGSCGKSSCEGCASKEKSNPQNFMAEQNVFSDVKHVIGVVSGKGGVGKILRYRFPCKCNGSQRIQSWYSGC